MHLAKRYDLQNSAKEMLLSAYFTNGENVADPSFLIHLGKSIGIDESEVVQMLESNLYADEVKMDALEAGKFGARGVPFFVFDRKYAISGAQPIEVFLDVLNKSYSEWSLKKIKA
jgi:predicted DsbA family dithiol-disulfide isomerase